MWQCVIVLRTHCSPTHRKSLFGRRKTRKAKHAMFSLTFRPSYLAVLPPYVLPRPYSYVHSLRMSFVCPHLPSSSYVHPRLNVPYPYVLRTSIPSSLYVLPRPYSSSSSRLRVAFTVDSFAIAHPTCFLDEEDDVRTMRRTT